MSVVEINAAIKKFLDEVLFKKGKVIGIAKTDGGWRVKVEIVEGKEALRWESYPKVSDRDIYEIILNDSFEVVSHTLIKGAAKEPEKEIIQPKGKVKGAKEAKIQARKERERLAQKARREKEEARREEEKARREEERARKEKERAQREVERLAKKAQLEKEKELKRLALEKERVKKGVKEPPEKIEEEPKEEAVEKKEKIKKEEIKKEEVKKEEVKKEEVKKEEVKKEEVKKEPPKPVRWVMSEQERIARPRAIAQFEKGILLYYKRHYQGAIIEFQKVIKDYPIVMDVVTKARQYIGFCRAKADKPR